MSNLNVPLILFLLVLVFFSYSVFQDFVVEIEKKDLFVFAYSYSSMKDYFANTNVKDYEYLKGYVNVDNFKILVDIALTDKQVQDGLSIKNTLNESQGMLFFLGEPRKASFWMKDMKFPIDIIWLDENFSIVHIEQELQPCTSIFNCKSYMPNSEALYVLETINGFTKKHGLKIGDNVEFQLIK
jgi:uncharacterized protein